MQRARQRVKTAVSKKRTGAAFLRFFIYLLYGLTVICQGIDRRGVARGAGRRFFNRMHERVKRHLF